MYHFNIVLDITPNYNQAIGLMSRVFANGLEDWGSIPGQVIPKTQKMVFDAALFNTQHYRMKGKVEQSREWSSTLPYTLVWWLLKRKPSGHPQLRSPTLLFTPISGVEALILELWWVWSWPIIAMSPRSALAENGNTCSGLGSAGDNVLNYFELLPCIGSKHINILSMKCLSV